jgi:hypothetical protein
MHVAQSRHCLYTLGKTNLEEHYMTCLSVLVDSAFSVVCITDLHKHANVRCAYNTQSYRIRITKLI